MNTFSNIRATSNLSNLRERIRLALALAGIATAIICSLSLLKDSYSSGALSLPSTTVSADLSIGIKDIVKVTTLWPGKQ